ncbi:MAG: hypothetical protein GX316_08095 [Firmicutes bacterium]|nr:hypothetical protein [Bacillota bacterium]
MKRRWIIVLAGLFLFTWFIAAHAKTLIIGVEDDMVTLDPADFSHRQTESALRQIYEGLSTYTPEREIVFELAENIKPLDQTTYEVKLRKDVRFHDGSPLTAQDVAFSINRLVKEGAMAGRTSERRGLLGPTKEAAAVDDYTVHIALESPWPLFPRFIPWQMIVPHTVGDRYITAPVGTGPFIYEEWVRDSHFSVVKNQNYWGTEPALDKVVFRVIGEAPARVAALRAGEIDIAAMVPMHEAKGLDNDPNIELVEVMGTRSHFLELNYNKPPFDDIRVRKAINYALDIETAVQLLYEGRATRIPNALSPQAFAYHEGLELYEYDPEKAQALLVEAGHPNGFEFEIDVVDAYRSRAEIYQAMLQQVGIKAKIRTWPTLGAVRETWMGAKQKPVSEQRDAFLNDWGNASLDPFDIIIPKFHSDAQGLGRGNFGGFNDPKVDALLEASLIAATEEEREAIFKQVQEIIYACVPMVFEFVTHELHGVRNHVKNWRPSPDGRFHLGDVDIVK